MIQMQPLSFELNDLEPIISTKTIDFHYQLCYNVNNMICSKGAVYYGTESYQTACGDTLQR